MTTGSVLHVVAWLGEADGVSVATKTMLEALGKRSDWATTVLIGVFAESGRSFAAPGVDVVEMGGAIPFAGKLGPSTGYPPRFGSTMSKALARSDVVHLHGLWLYPTLVGSRIARRHGVPYLVSPHGSLMPGALIQKSWKKQIVLRTWERSNLNHAARLVAASDTEAQAFVQLNLRAPTAVIPYALSAAAGDYLEPRARRRLTSANPDGNTLLTVGRFHPTKRFVELIDVFSRLADEYLNWRLVIVGSKDDPAYRTRVLHTAAGSPAASRISVFEDMTGPELWNLYLASELFALPSLTENFGLVVIEALAAGTPVIATRGAPWLELEAQHCGWWIDTSVEALAMTLKEAMSLSRSHLVSIGRRGIALVAARYSPEAQGDALASLYETVRERH